MTMQDLPLPPWLERLFREAGFELETLHGHSWRAHREVDGREVVYGPEAERRLHHPRVSGAPADGAYLVLAHDVPVHLRAEAARTGQPLLSPGEFIARLGSILEVRSLPPSPQTAIDRALPLPAGFPAAPSALPPLLFERDRYLRPRLGTEDAEEFASSRLSAYRVRHLLVPFALFAYRLTPGTGAGAEGGNSRLVAVPLVTGDPQFWAGHDREVLFELSPRWKRHPERRSLDEARSNAFAAVRARHGPVEDRSERRGGVLLIDRQVRSLNESDVEMGDGSPLWVPHFLLEGHNGRVILDAVTGIPSALELEDLDPASG